jgi:hypothetical protein
MEELQRRNVRLRTSDSVITRVTGAEPQTAKLDLQTTSVEWLWHLNGSEMDGVSPLLKISSCVRR